MRRWRPILPGENEDRQLWHRFPAEIISHAVWLYHVFSLNLHDVELILAEHGIAVYPALVPEVRFRLCRRLRRRQPQSGKTCTSIKCSSASAACCTFCGEWWISLRLQFDSAGKATAGWSRGCPKSRQAMVRSTPDPR
jgi:hypothetical protein